MLHIDARNRKSVQCDLTPEELPALLADKKHFVNVDAIEPTEADWEVLTRVFAFHPLAIEDARHRGQRAKVDHYDEHLFISVHAPVEGDDPEAELPTREIDLFVGPNFLVTVHDVGSPILDAVRLRRRTAMPEGRDLPGHALHLVLDAVVDAYFPVLDRLDSEIDAMETQIYQSGVDDLQSALELKKRLLHLRQALAPLRDVINHLLRIDDPQIIAPELRVFYQDVYDHTLRLVEQVDLHRDILGTVLEAAMAQTGNRLNQVMKTMTGVSTILMTLALVAGIYGMNFKNMPELLWPRGYFLALGLMGVLAIGLAVFFRRIKWF